MSNSSRDLEDAHNKGQSDAGRNSYNQPVPMDPSAYLYGDEAVKDWNELNDSYDKGWDNGS
ncbi:MAG: hypothetical protein AABO58_25415 [Acidobacteriota bacterium]